MIAMGLLGWCCLHWLKLPLGTYLPPLIFPNNGNMGLPLCLFAFGQTGLALALGSFMVMMIATFTLGLILVTQGGWRERLYSIARQPVIYAMALAVVILITHTQLPRWASNTVDLLGGIAISLMVIALGVSLATLKIQFLRRSIGFSLGRVLGGLVLGFGVSELMGLEGVSRAVVILQSVVVKQ